MRVLKLPMVLVGLAFALWWAVGGFDNFGIVDTKSAPEQPNKIYVPVVYDVADFEQNSKPIKANVKEWLMALGGVATGETALDWQGQKGVLYRYHHKSEPAFYVIDSEAFFEMVWYYPTAKDTDKDKALAKRYASLSYGIVKSALGEQARVFFAELLQGKSPNLPKGVLSAQCQDYLCRVVFKKSVIL